MTAMLDANTQALIWQGVLTFVRQQQVGLVVISHDQPLLGRVCDRILDLSNGSTASKDLLSSKQLNLTRSVF